MIRAALGLGANLGDPQAALVDAVAGLSAHPDIEVTAVSGLWDTTPVGGPEQPDYRNAVVLVAAELTPAELLAVAHSLEATAGRVRDVRWGPRTLDVDVLDVEGVVSSDETLTLPHPRAHERAFVLVPWAQVAPDWVLTAAGQQRTVADWAELVAAESAADAVRLVDGGTWWT